MGNRKGGRNSYFSIDTVVHQTVLFFPFDVVHPGELGESPVHLVESRMQVNNVSNKQSSSDTPFQG
jgi:hypothetical protein